MNEAVQGATCQQCKEPVLIWDLALLADTPETGRVHGSTCIGCVKQLNNLRSKK